MTIDEAIIHAEEVAARNEEYAKIHAHGDEFEQEDAFKCEECAKEHYQLSSWLKDYKRLLNKEKSHEKINNENTLETEEAIEILINHLEFYDRPFDNTPESCIEANKIHQALWMAISALNQEPVRDFIKYAKDQGVDISLIYNRDNPDTFEKIFGIRPCENCVSRVLVQEEITKSIELKENPYQLWQRIQALPPVQPKLNMEESENKDEKDRCMYCKEMFDLFCAKAKKSMTYEEFFKAPYKPSWCPGRTPSEKYHD